MPRPPIHPGEHLRIDLETAGVSQRRLAAAIQVPPNRISEIIQGRRSITADTALRLARVIGTTPQYWLNLQANYDLRKALQDEGDAIERSVTPIPELSVA